jgi:hypothetical protein
MPQLVVWTAGQLPFEHEAARVSVALAQLWLRHCVVEKVQLVGEAPVQLAPQVVP